MSNYLPLEGSLFFLIFHTTKLVMSKSPSFFTTCRSFEICMQLGIQHLCKRVGCFLLFSMIHSPEWGITTHEEQLWWKGSFLLKKNRWRTAVQFFSTHTHTFVCWCWLLRLGWRLLSSKDVGLQKRHLVVERWNFQPSRRLDPKCSTLCQQGSYCILLRFRSASTKITGSAFLLHEAQTVGLMFKKWWNKWLQLFSTSELFFYSCTFMKQVKKAKLTLCFNQAPHHGGISDVWRHRSMHSLPQH